MNAPKHVLEAVDHRIALNAFFHASRHPLPVGQTLCARAGRLGIDRYVNDERPAGVPERGAHFFMVDDPLCFPQLLPAGEYHLYQVTPQTDVLRTDFGWIDDIIGFTYAEPSIAAPKIAAAAKAYWSGQIRPDGEPCLTEYLTTTMRIDGEVSRNSPQHPGFEFFK